MKFLKGLAVLGLTSMLFFNSIGLADDIKKEESKEIILEVKPEAGKISNYSGSFEMECFVMHNIKMGNFKMWMDMDINEEVIEDEDCELTIKQRLYKKGNVAYHWNLFESEKMDEIVENSFKADEPNLIYDILKFLPDKPINLFERWNKDIGIDFLRLSSSLFNYPIENIERKQLESALFGLDKEKHKATIYFNMNDDMKDYNNKNFVVRNGSFFFLGNTNIEYEKKELIDVEMHFSYLFDGNIKGEDIFIRLSSDFNLKNDEYKE